MVSDIDLQLDHTPETASELAAELTGRSVAVLEDLVGRHLPDWRIPGTFAGHRVEPDVAADLVFTLGHLADAGVTEVAGTPVDEAISRVLARIDGPNTHTFFSYRVAETLARHGPFADNRLLEGWSEAARANVATACDSTSWIELLDLGLPRNYAAVLARCELGRRRLGLDVDPSVLDGLVGRVRATLGANPDHHLDDSTHGVGRYDIYSADVWLFTEPLAPSLGPMWTEGVRGALALVEQVGSRDGTSVAWGRSTGVLGAALTIELGALALAGDHTDRPALWARRVADAVSRLGPLVRRRAGHRPPAPVALRLPGSVPSPAAHPRPAGQAGLGRRTAARGGRTHRCPRRARPGHRLPTR